jgi:hypothetical protein
MNEITNSDTFFALTGGFWTKVYANRAEPRTLAEIVTEFARQGAVDAQAAAAAVGRRSINPYRRTRLFPLEIRASQRNAIPGALLRYGDGAVYGPQTSGVTYNYGESLLPFYLYPVPENLRGFASVVPRITSPADLWSPGVDVVFDQERSALIFREDPITSAAVGTSVIADGADTVATLWLVDALFDEGDVYSRHGFAFRFGRGMDSAELKDVLAPVADAVVSGNNRELFYELLEVTTGVPRARATETVETVASDHRGWFVVTPQHVYRCPSEPNCAAGETIAAGTFLTQDVRLHDFGRGTAPDWLPNIALGEGTTLPEYTGLVLRNAATALTASTSSVRFDMGTHPNVEAFFTSAEAKASEAGTTLRAFFESALGRPLPATIRPLAFFASEWLRGAWYVVKLSATAASTLRFQHLSRLTALCPPGVILVIAADLPPTRAPLRIGASRTSTWTGASPAAAALAAPACRATVREITNCQS